MSGAPSSTTRRARQLDGKVIEIRGRIREQWLTLGKVLAEIQQTLAYRELGFANFQQYVEDRLAVSARWANYLVCTVRKAERFGIRPETLVKLEISKSLEIFRLDDSSKARRLIDQTLRHDTPLRELRQQVAEAIGQATEGEPQTIRKVWYFSPSQWAVISQAIKTVQLSTGSDSESYAVELIAADYLAGVGLDAA